DLDSGKELWSVTEIVKGRVSYNGSRSVPAVTKDHVISTNLLGWVYAFSRSEHKTVWKKSLLKEYSASAGGFGFVQSALIYEGTVIFAPSSQKAGLIALEESTGKEVWKSDPIAGAGYATPILSSINGEDQVLTLTNSGLFAHNPKTGKKLWEYLGYRCNTPIPAPTVLNDGRVFITGGYKAGSTMISVKKNYGASYEIRELFRIEFRGSQIQPALFYKNHLYANFNFNANIKRRPDGLICMDLAGKLQWQTKKDPHIGRGNLILLGDSILTLGGDDGVLRLVEANSKKYVELGAKKVFNSKQMWAPMAFSKGKLVLRSQKELKCLELNP
ncbi:MAG: PQQ-binding-like beta-propeller repeat protein, partial [Planctomycetota bacterium]|nr:PQQ-binding-like beta-propeller repeat protein [Planctomycetota bacterium]